MPAVPHPVPYQGSKRRLAARILGYAPAAFDRLIEPFAGSAAVTLAAASRGLCQRYVLADRLAPLAALWQSIVEDPDGLAGAYETLWTEALPDPRARFDAVRDAYNLSPTPAQLLYLLARCVKNAVRFNQQGHFNQAPDQRRLGTHPTRMRTAIVGAHGLLAGRTTVHAGDYRAVLAGATERDLVYLDPPYQGTSTGRDRRYLAPLDLPALVDALRDLSARRVPFLVSLDGCTGNRTYGPGLPRELGLRRVELPAGRSAQATLHGRLELTVESLYLSSELVRRRSKGGARASGVIQPATRP